MLDSRIFCTLEFIEAYSTILIWNRGTPATLASSANRTEARWSSLQFSTANVKATLAWTLLDRPCRKTPEPSLPDLVRIISVPQLQHHDVPNKRTVKIAAFLIVSLEQSFQALALKIPPLQRLGIEQ